MVLNETQIKARALIKEATRTTVAYASQVVVTLTHDEAAQIIAAGETPRGKARDVKIQAVLDAAALRRSKIETPPPDATAEVDDAAAEVPGEVVA